MTKKLHKNSFLLSLLIHLLLLLLIVKVITVPLENKQQHSAKMYTPAYVYTSPITPSRQQYKQNTESLQNTENSQNSQKAENTKQAQKNSSVDKNGLFKKSVLDMSRETLHRDQFESAMKNNSEEEPMLLIGDTTHEADPFVREIGLALSKNFRYPEFEGRMGERGRVIISLTLHPEGNFSDIQILKSSDVQAFDMAALYAINKAPTIVGARRYLSKPKHMVIGFIFD